MSIDQAQGAYQAQTYAQTQDKVNYVPVYPQQPMAQQQAYVPAPTSFLSLDVSSATFWKGAVLGAGVTLLVTNETVQKAVVKTFSKVMAATSAGIEEMKEKYEDAKAEVEAEAAGKK